MRQGGLTSKVEVGEVMLGHKAQMDAERVGLESGLNKIEEAFGRRGSGNLSATAPPNDPNRIGKSVSEYSAVRHLRRRTE